VCFATSPYVSSWTNLPGASGAVIKTDLPAATRAQVTLRIGPSGGSALEASPSGSVAPSSLAPVDTPQPRTTLAVTVKPRETDAGNAGGIAALMPIA